MVQVSWALHQLMLHGLPVRPAFVCDRPSTSTATHSYSGIG